MNLVCVNLAVQIVFLAKGIRLRTWWEKQSARQSVRVNLAVWAVLLVLLVALILMRRA